MSAALSADARNLHHDGDFTLLRTGRGRWVLFTPAGQGCAEAGRLLVSHGITGFVVTDQWVTQRGRVVTHLLAD